MFRKLFAERCTKLLLFASPDDFQEGEQSATLALRVFMGLASLDLDKVTGDSTLALPNSVGPAGSLWQGEHHDQLFEVKVSDSLSLEKFITVAYGLLEATVWNTHGRVVFTVADGDTGYYELKSTEYARFVQALHKANIKPPSSWPTSADDLVL